MKWVSCLVLFLFLSTPVLAEHQLSAESTANDFTVTSSVYYAGFESGSTDADVGHSMLENSFSQAYVRDNPAPSAVNPSKKVLKEETTTVGNIRMEYSSQRLPVSEKTYIYAWKELLPDDFFAGKHFGWAGIGQWKTYPCEDGSTNPEYAIYSDLICPGAGIFNHRNVSANSGQPEQEFKFRAEPDCYSYTRSLDLGEWHAYVLEIYWTNSSDGYYNLYMDGVLIQQQSQLKTLFDQFIPGTCDMYWAMGVYANWADEGAGIIEYYLDDIAIFDENDGVTVEQVLDWQGYSASPWNLFIPALLNKKKGQ